MKKVEIEEKITRTVYVAFDGTEFDTVTQCENYEGSALGVLLERIKNSIIKRVDDLGIYPDWFSGCNYNAYYVIEPKTRTDVFVLNQILSMVPGNEETVVSDDSFQMIVLALDLRCNTVMDAHIIRFNDIVKELTDGKFEVVTFIKNEEQKVKK